MNQYRFIFFFYIIFSYFNEIKEVGLLNKANINDVYKQSKRLFTAKYCSEEDNVGVDFVLNPPANKKGKTNN
jgi:hypothetical protein